MGERRLDLPPKGRTGRNPSDRTPSRLGARHRTLAPGSREAWFILQRQAGNAAVNRMLRASSSPSPEPPSLVIQRSLGLELECTGLPITSVVKESRPTIRAKADVERLCQWGCAELV